MKMPDQLIQSADAKSDVALFDLGPRAQIELRGKDRQSFLHNFCTNDIKKLSPGLGCEAFLTNIKGRILGHIIVSATDESLWIDSEPGTAEFIVSHLDKYIITEDVTIADRTTDFTPLLLIGPQSEAWLTSHLSDFTPPPLWGQVNTTLDGVEIMLRRVGFTSQTSFEFLTATPDAAPLRQSIIEGGVPSMEYEVFAALRIEAGFPRYGVDLTDANLAQEANRTEQAISFTKGCYLGQEPIARLDALGHVNKDLRRLALENGPVPAPGTPVLSTNGDIAGHITSAASSPATGLPIALAMLKTTGSSTVSELLVGTTPAKTLPADRH